MRKLNSQNSGFSVAEIFVIAAIIAVLVAIGVPSWLSFLNGQRMRVAQVDAASALRLAQAGARRENLQWIAAFRTNNNRVQWSVNRSSTPTSQWSWVDLAGNSADQIQISSTATNFTTSSGIYQFSFDYDGRVSASNSIPARITFQPRNITTAAQQRCVRILTLLGALNLDKGSSCNS
ncbi:hypothetical protein RIF25_07345 [Thermosynechococcaceae cyanobacterium BACA0444]|uniref:Prepilin-type N-terminal cleavage/methylation domain-containing protein n=1 Tax=Pseudocalidococcus azoricus BACA0444 TaxID=2918990 RepID=A0AAE4JY47_9CYAN|nr:hypothetical protein [Pseudocalidococcus azoricus]MDS3860624.1 hypothetical protein [Pseudocalidococcus azoricus BACA0444]